MTAFNSRDLLPYIAEIARQLLADMQNIQAACDDWNNIPLAREQLGCTLDQALARLAETNIWGVENRLPSGQLWEIAGERLACGELLHQARFKPRGYAGDDLMLGRICEDWRCTDPLGSLLDHYFQSHAAPQAVRNRTAMMTQAIVGEVERWPGQVVRVASVGSGPAIDVARAIEQLAPRERARLEVTLLDLDPQALESARQRLVGLHLQEEQLAVRRENLYRLPRRAAQLADKPYDLIFCTGFFDYLNDNDASALLSLLWKSLATHGRLVVFNFAPHHPSCALMEWIGNWYLIYRDEQQMRELAQLANIPTFAYRISAEPLGIDLAIDARR